MFPSSDNGQNNRPPAPGVFRRSSPGSRHERSRESSGPNVYLYGRVARRRKITKAPIEQKYVYGQPLVDDEKLRQMPTNLRNFHE
jgi:hypothetical protein